MPSAYADTTGSLPVDFAKGVAKACDAALDRHDLKAARARKCRSSDGHTMIDVLERAPLKLIVEVLRRRLKTVKRRERASERQKACRAKLRRARLRAQAQG